jgi:hypothetical protein
MPGNAATLAICFIPGRNPPIPPNLVEHSSSSNINFSKWLLT